MPKYTAWMKETPADEIRDGQTASHERFIGKHMAKAAIRDYDDTWQGNHGHELTTRQSVRKFANELAYASEVNP